MHDYLKTALIVVITLAIVARIPALNNAIMGP